MPGISFLLALLFKLDYCVGQITSTTTTKDCCAMRTVLGSSDKSGTYNLKDENDSRCPDGCLYSKGDLDVCFKANYNYVASCDETTSQNPKTYIEYWNMDQTLFEPLTIADRGEWGPDEFCSPGSYAASFQLYVADYCDRRCSRDDDVALMGIKLFCAQYNDTTKVTEEISSSIMTPCEKTRGKCAWLDTHSCPQGQLIWKSKYLSEYFHDFQTTGEGAAFTCPPGPICRNETVAGSDPMGGLNIDMGCTDGTDLVGDGIAASEIPLSPEGEETIFWSPWTECPAGYAICGIKSKVHQGETDKMSNMGQTAVLFHCCQVPPEFYN